MAETRCSLPNGQGTLPDAEWTQYDLIREGQATDHLNAPRKDSMKSRTSGESKS